MLDKITHCFDEAITSIAEDFKRELLPYCIAGFEIISLVVMVIAVVWGPLVISDYLPFSKDPSIWWFVIIFGMWGGAALIALVLQRAYMVCKHGDRNESSA